MDTTLTTGTDETWAGWVFSECNLVGHPPEPHWHPPVGNTPHAPVADAVAELARAVGALDTPDGQDFAHRLAADMFAALRADPAAARAVRDAIDPDGLRAIAHAARDVNGLWDGEDGQSIRWQPEAAEALEDLRALLEGTPDAD